VQDDEKCPCVTSTYHQGSRAIQNAYESKDLPCVLLF
jgi:hypothetical protein